MTAPDSDRAIRRAAVIAGGGLLLMSALAAFGNLVALEGMVEPGDAARTAVAVMDAEGLFRLAIVSLFAVIALDVVVAWALYRVLSPVDRSLSLLAAWLRLAFAGVFLVAVGGLVGVPRLLDGDHLAPFSTAQRQSLALEQINSFHDLWAAGLFLFGLHLLGIGHLVYRSHYLPGSWASCSRSPVSAMSSTAWAPPSSETPGATSLCTPSSGSFYWRCGS